MNGQYGRVLCLTDPARMRAVRASRDSHRRGNGVGSNSTGPQPDPVRIPTGASTMERNWVNGQGFSGRPDLPATVPFMPGLYDPAPFIFSLSPHSPFRPLGDDGAGALFLHALAEMPRCAAAHSIIGCTDRVSFSPSAVNEYSTLGGASANTSLRTSPSRCSSRRVSDSVLGLMPGNASDSALNRSRG